MADGPATAARPRRDSANLSKVPYLPGLDGMRALAVAAVMVYHANPEWLPGGFLGVEVFFVISGYLITLLLMAERERSGSVDLLNFWKRRARRLLPALFTMMLLVTIYTAFFRAEALGKLRGELLAGLFYVSNWYQIWIGQGYTATGDFDPLRHLWSLAVEEQYYIVWPVIMILLLRGGTQRIASMAKWLVAASLLITVLMAVLYYPGRIGTCELTPDAYWMVDGRCISKIDTLYLSTITRAGGLLLGGAFAMVWRPVAIMRGPLRRRGAMLDGVALVGLVLLGMFTWWMYLLKPDGADPFLFRGGFFLTGVATLFVISAVTHRRAVTGKILAFPVLLWIGTRSYGLYLYHWPIYQIIRGVAGNPLSFTQFAVAIVITCVITEISYTLIETPIRRGQVGDWWRGLRAQRDPVPRQLVAGGAVVVVLLSAFGVYRVAAAPVEQNEIAAGIAEGEEHNTDLADILGGDEGAAPPDETPPPTATTVAPSVAPPPSVSGPTTTTTTSTTSTTTTTTLPQEPIDFLAIGDSVMLGAAPTLADRGYTVNAEVSRQMIDMVPVMKQLGDAELFGDPIVIHLGTNGPFTRETLDEFLAPLSGVPNVIMLNVRANRSWTASNNQILADRDSPGDNIILIDWNSVSNNCPGNCFASDGIHLNDAGQRFYADTIGDVTGR